MFNLSAIRSSWRNMGDSCNIGNKNRNTNFKILVDNISIKVVHGSPDCYIVALL